MKFDFLVHCAGRGDAQCICCVGVHTAQHLFQAEALLAAQSKKLEPVATVKAISQYTSKKNLRDGPLRANQSTTFRDIMIT